MSGLHANNWTYGELEPGGEVEAYIIDSDGDMVAQFWAVESKDGRLMAAAPRLAEALKRCADIVESHANAEYPEEFRARSDYQRQGYERDMEAVHAARAALREAEIAETGDN